MQIIHNTGQKRPADFDFAPMQRDRLGANSDKVTRQRNPANMNVNMINTDYQLGSFDPPLPCKHSRPPPNPNQIKRWASSGLRDWCKHCNPLTSPNLVRHGEQMSGLARYNRERSGFKNDDFPSSGNHSPAYAHEDSDSSDVEETHQLVCDDDTLVGAQWIGRRGDRLYKRGDLNDLMYKRSSEIVKQSGGMTTVYNSDLNTDLPSIERQTDVEMEIASPKSTLATDSEPMEEDRTQSNPLGGMNFDVNARGPMKFNINTSLFTAGNFGGYVVQNQSGGTDFGVGPVPPSYEEAATGEPKTNPRSMEPRPPTAESKVPQRVESEFPGFPPLGAPKPHNPPARPQPATEEKRSGGTLQSIFQLVKPHKKERD